MDYWGKGGVSSTSVALSDRFFLQFGSAVSNLVLVALLVQIPFSIL